MVVVHRHRHLDRRAAPVHAIHFDLLCSDLRKVRLARAAAASSAVPIVLSPVTFNNYGGRCNYQYMQTCSPISSSPATAAVRPDGH